MTAGQLHLWVVEDLSWLELPHELRIFEDVAFLFQKGIRRVRNVPADVADPVMFKRHVLLLAARFNSYFVGAWRRLWLLKPRGPKQRLAVFTGLR